MMNGTEAVKRPAVFADSRIDSGGKRFGTDILAAGRNFQIRSGVKSPGNKKHG